MLHRLLIVAQQTGSILIIDANLGIVEPDVGVTGTIEQVYLYLPTIDNPQNNDDLTGIAFRIVSEPDLIPGFTLKPWGVTARGIEGAI